MRKDLPTIAVVSERATTLAARLFLQFVALVALLATVAAAQDAKRVVTYAGTVRDATGMPRFGSVGITVSLYADREGGEPLWRESQTVQLDSEGRYTLLIGATEREGLPLEVFTDRKAQWLGVQEEGEAEQPRIFLLTVPYALKAADADTVGGRPLSAFVLYEDLEKAATSNPAAATTVVQNGAPLTPSANTAAHTRSDKVTQRLQLSGGITPVAYNEAGSNTWFGEGAGASITTGTNNSFFGQNAGNKTSGGETWEASGNSFFGSGAGYNNTTGFYNLFLGWNAGLSNTTGFHNSFIGTFAGGNNTTGYANSFVGLNTGGSNTTGIANSFFGLQAGYYNSTGESNSFVGYETGLRNTTGTANSFFGIGAGASNTVEDYNSTFGAQSDIAAGITNATAIGARANVTQSNSLVLGSINGVSGATADTKVGIGTTAPGAKLDVVGTYGLPGSSIPTSWAERASGRRGVVRGNRGLYEDIWAGPYGYYAELSSYKWDDKTTLPLVLNANGGNVGIGAVNPKARLQTDGGDIYVGSPGQGIILKSPDGLLCVRLTVNNAGQLVSTPQACP